MPDLTLDQAFRLAVQHHQAGQLAEAEAVYRQILIREPRHAGVLNYMGVLAHQAGRSNVAVDLIGRAIALQPNFPEAYSNLGNALKDAGRLDEAIAACRQAIALKPHHAAAHHNLGNALKAKGQIDEAIAEYREALRCNPDLPEAHNNLGNSLVAKGQLDEAIAEYLAAVSIRPNYAEAHSHLGNTLKGVGRIDEAIAACRQAIACNPRLAEAHYNLGSALQASGQIDVAIAAYREAIRLNPKLTAAYNNLGGTLAGSGRLDDALAVYREALTIDPGNAAIDGNFVYALHFHPAYDAEALAQEHRRWSRQHAQSLASRIAPHQNEHTPTRRIRVGYLSPDFRLHPVGQSLLPVLEQHDAAEFEIVCFSNVDAPDSVTARFQQCAHLWRSLVSLSDDQAADLIRGEKIDILVDLSLHMSRNRLLVFARKPAPVQVTWLGYPSTTGLSAIDYRLSDPFLDPPGTDPPYVEKTLRLPHSYLCWRWNGAKEEISPLPMLVNGYVTFGSLNSFSKVGPEVLAVWARILKNVPNARLILRCPAGETSHRVRTHFASHGVSPDRLELRPMSPWAEYVEQICRQDICLDPFPYPGHTTSCDALWMGVPVVTLAGATAVGRGGVSLLSNLGLLELIAADAEQYVRIAVSLAGDVKRLAELRSTLRQRMERSPLMDAPKFARNLEAAYRQMWRAWCESASAP
jgi:predicted O-linked N-acetylglucosamine transferase (SPINDLY family)